MNEVRFIITKQLSIFIGCFISFCRKLIKILIKKYGRKMIIPNVNP